MPTIHVQAGSTDHLQEIADCLWKAKKVVIVTGAGISTNSGIPDFRSENGLYSMIQGQFDAAAKLNGTKNQAIGVQLDDSGDEQRPRKRRKTSPVGDSIEVGVSKLDRDGPIKGDSIVVIDTHESRVSDVSRVDDDLRSLTHTGDAGPCDETDLGHDRTGPTEEEEEEEVVLLTEESVMENEPIQLDPGPDRQRESLHNPDAHFDRIEKGNSPHTPQVPARTVLTASASRRSSRHGSPVLEAKSLHQQHRGPPFSESSAPRSRKHSPDPHNASSSRSSTPKQSPSDSGAQTNSLSSPLSSPPPHLSDPYEELFPRSPACSSSRCTSPESSSEALDSAPSSQRFEYSQTYKRASLSTLKGRDLFDASIWSDPVKTSVFYTFATNLRQKSRDAYPTGSHHFISHLRDSGRMVRCYTQNIDLLEDKVGLSTRLLLGPGSRSRFSTRASRAAAATATATSTPVAPIQTDEGSRGQAVDTASQQSEGRSEEDAKASMKALVQPMTIESTKDQCPQGGAQQVPSSPEIDRGVECVYLHGSLRSLRCFQCRGVIDWDEGDRELQTMSGHQPPCPRCEDATTARQERGKRALGVGKLRPDIVLYGEEHPESQRISDIIQHDLSLAPDLLIIMGTSLKVHGLKTVVKEFAKAIHNKKDGKVIFVNYTKPADSVWADTIDFWVEMDCDAWVRDLKEKKPIIWSPPGTTDDVSRSAKKRRRATIEPEKATTKRNGKDDGMDEKPLITPLRKLKKDKNKVLQAVPKLSAPKPAPKRPVSEREHKDNGAYWTTRIMANLALLSGRKVKKLKHSRLPSPAKKASVAVQAVVRSAKQITSEEPLKKRCGPRLKNARTRNPVVTAAKTSRDSTQPASTANRSASPQPDQAEENQKFQADTPPADHPDLPQHYTTPTGRDEYHVPLTETPPSEALVTLKAGDRVSPRELIAGIQPTSNISQRESIPNTKSSLDATGARTSIVAAVKSHHRIRRPKAIFEPEAKKRWRGTTASSASAKPKANAVSQARKMRRSAKMVRTEQAKIIKDENQSILPPPRTGPASQSNTGNPPGPQRYDNLDEVCTLAPLQPENLESYKYPHQFKERPYPPARPLEPIVITEGPPSDMSPTTMSPQHWQNRAFLLRDPQSRNFEGPCRGLDFVDLPPAAQPEGQDAVMSAPSAPLPPAQLATQLAMIVNAPVPSAPNPEIVGAQPPPPTQTVVDSPGQGLRQEEALEAAAALSQLRSPPAFDQRYFVRV